jgi:rare lipoprotein A
VLASSTIDRRTLAWWECMMVGRLGRLINVLFLILAGGCALVVEQAGGPPPEDIDVAGLPDAVPRAEPLSKYGNPDSYVVNGRRYHTLKSSDGFVERGIASWYGSKFHGRRTSSGEAYDMYKMTAAHPRLPLPTYVEVENVENGRRAVVKVNDRGPFHQNRVIDLSYAAAKKLGIAERGTGLVEIRAISAGERISPEPEVRIAAKGSAPMRFYLQVGAFGERRNAERMRDRVKSVVDRLTQVHPGIYDGATVYRVRIGPISDVDVADRIVNALSGIGVTEHFVVFK